MKRKQFSLIKIQRDGVYEFIISEVGTPRHDFIMSVNFDREDSQLISSEIVNIHKINMTKHLSVHVYDFRYEVTKTEKELLDMIAESGLFI